MNSIQLASVICLGACVSPDATLAFPLEEQEARGAGKGSSDRRSRLSSTFLALGGGLLYASKDGFFRLGALCRPGGVETL